MKIKLETSLWKFVIVPLPVALVIAGTLKYWLDWRWLALLAAIVTYLVVMVLFHRFLVRRNNEIVDGIVELLKKGTSGFIVLDLEVPADCNNPNCPVHGRHHTAYRGRGRPPSEERSKSDKDLN